MSSIDEKMKHMPKISIDFCEQFVLEIKHGEMSAQVVVCCTDLSFQIDGKTSVILCSYNPKAIDNNTQLFPSLMINP